MTASTDQREPVLSMRLPARIIARDGTTQAQAQAQFEALGFTFGPPDPDDPLFRAATLPPGWTRVPGTHKNVSYLLDEHGRERVTVYCKAAYWDRKAHMVLGIVDWYVTMHVEYGGPLVMTDTWATRGAVHAALVRSRDYHAEEAAEFRSCAADESDTRRDARNREQCRRIAAEEEVAAALYQAKLTELFGEDDEALG